MKRQRVLFIFKNLSVEPLGMMYLSAELQQHNHIVGAYEYGNGIELKKSIDEFKPDVVAFSMTTGQHVDLLLLAKLVKCNNPEVKIVIGGSHVTYFPQIINEAYVDYILRGEADYSFPKLVNNLGNGVVIKKKDVSELVLPVDLDSLPFPDRKLFYQFDTFGKNTVRNVMTSRGCPYNCSYCYNSVYRELYKGQKIVRYRSPKKIVEECVQVKNDFKTTMFFFADDEFSMLYERLKEIKDRYVKEVNLPFHCQVRIDNLDEKRVRVLKEMGCYSLTFAIESGNEDTRKLLLDRNISNQQIIDGTKLLKRYGIKFRAENMIGLPGENFEHLMQTVKLNQRVKPDYAWVSLYQPFPSTKLGEFCRTSDLFDYSKIDLIRERFFDDTVLRMSDDERKQVINLQRLFGLIVAFPLLNILIKSLLSVKSNKFYTWLRDKWKKYCYRRLFKW